MKELITKKEEYYELTNDLTREMDTYLKYKCKFKTYIYISFIGDKQYILIRYPGATRGNIIVDDNMIIKEINLYNDECHTDKIYNSEIRDCFSKYIGMKFIYNL